MSTTYNVRYSTPEYKKPLEINYTTVEFLGLQIVRWYVHNHQRDFNLMLELTKLSKDGVIPAAKMVAMAFEKTL